jgi:hypothetical protein
MRHFADASTFATLRTELLGQLGETIEHAMCDGTTKAGALVAVTRMVRQLPELASATGFDCFFQKRKEEAVLASALEAFGEAQLPPSTALAELARREDPRRRRPHGRRTRREYLAFLRWSGEA